MADEIAPAPEDTEEEFAFITDEPLQVGEGGFVVFLPSSYIGAGYSGILLVGGDVYLHKVEEGKLYRQEIVKDIPKPKSGAVRAIKKDAPE